MGIKNYYVIRLNNIAIDCSTRFWHELKDPGPGIHDLDARNSEFVLAGSVAKCNLLRRQEARNRPMMIVNDAPKAEASLIDADRRFSNACMKQV
jgi:hypothetical protein